MSAHDLGITNTVASILRNDPALVLGLTSPMPEDRQQAMDDLRAALQAGLGEDYERRWASQPELLASCKELCTRLEHNELVNRPDNPCNHYDQPAYDRALAAIAKAKGESK